MPYYSFIPKALDERDAIALEMRQPTGKNSFKIFLTP